MRLPAQILLSQVGVGPVTERGMEQGEESGASGWTCKRGNMAPVTNSACSSSSDSHTFILSVGSKGLSSLLWLLQGGDSNTAMHTGCALGRAVGRETGARALGPAPPLAVPSPWAHLELRMTLTFLLPDCGEAQVRTPVTAWGQPQLLLCACAEERGCCVPAPAQAPPRHIHNQASRLDHRACTLFGQDRTSPQGTI